MADNTSNRFLIVCGGTGVNLLGLRRILGVAAELQVDVSRENVIRGRRTYDRNSLYVDLDKQIGTTAVVVENANKRINKKSRSKCVYIEEGISDTADINHIRFLLHHYPVASALEYGLAQSPAIGKYTVMHELNRSDLIQAFDGMLNTEGVVVGPQNPVEVWIVASTAGGTGEGTHRFVAALFADYVQSNYADTPMTINFIRVGQLTYRSVNPHRTALNSFFGIAADSAFALKAKKDFSRTTTNWFYLDLPDVGTGDRAKNVRADIVEMAAKAIMLDDLQDDLQKLLVNNSGIPMVIVRTGYWGRDFDDNVKYFETLRQVVVKLKDLIEPNYYKKYIENRVTPDFQAPGIEEWTRQVQSGKFVIDRIEKANWQFPRFRLPGIPKDLATIDDLIPRWIQSMNELLTADVDDFDVHYQVEEVIIADGKESRQILPLSVPATIEENEEWFNKVENIHRAKSWSMHLLGIDYQTREVAKQGLIATLLSSAKVISDALYGFSPLKSSTSRANEASKELGNFLLTLVKTYHLLSLERNATRMLDRELSEPKEVLKKAISELEIAKNLAGVTGAASIQAAELSDVLDRLAHKTWLRLLREAARSGDADRFQDEILRGATGLTYSGLQSVLNLKATDDIPEIQNTLSKHMGRMVSSNGQELEAPWWQAKRPVQTMEFQYRIIPRVDRELQARLKSRGDIGSVDYRYVFTGLGVLGLYVLAFHGVSLNATEGPDTVSAPAFLLSPFVPIIQQELNRWVERPIPNQPAGQFAIASAGAVGEPLYLDALSKAGLVEEDIKKIGQFYKFYIASKEDIEEALSRPVTMLGMEHGTDTTT